MHAAVWFKVNVYSNIKIVTVNILLCQATLDKLHRLVYTKLRGNHLSSVLYFTQIHLKATNCNTNFELIEYAVNGKALIRSANIDFR